MSEYTFWVGNSDLTDTPIDLADRRLESTNDDPPIIQVRSKSFGCIFEAETYSLRATSLGNFTDLFRVFPIHPTTARAIRLVQDDNGISRDDVVHIELSQETKNSKTGLRAVESKVFAVVQGRVIYGEN